MKILLVDDEQHSRQAMLWFLKHQNHEVTECASGTEALQKFTVENYPLVLSDIQMPGMSGVELATAINQFPNSWQTDIVLFTGHADLNSAVTALRAGVYDYLEKPVNPEELASVIERVAEHQALLRENKVLTERFYDEVNVATQETRRELVHMKQIVAKSIIGSVGIFSESMKRIVQQAQQLHIDRSIPVLIEGETGTGKEVIAKIIHYGNGFEPLSTASFVDINCAALAPTLFESELFGHEAGSFTGSLAKGAKGKFDLAHGGTLFLDEIGEIPPDLQGKLLRVLQEKEFYRVGGLKKIKTNIRVICATNLPLEQGVEQGTFRKDLYFRLKVAHIVIPPLRKRKEEIIPIATMFLQEFSRRKKKDFATIDSQTARIMEEYDWPGNVRELQNIIEYVTFAYNDKELKPEHIMGLLQHQGERPSSSLENSGMLEIPFPLQGYSLKKYTEDIILKVLAAHHNNQSATAKYLGISRRALSYRLEEMRKKKEENMD
ncbi:MAG: two component, sigma54 specific, transcriptional regulator, Fis family [Firmicutes bacterium]|nr:two component, sigma54 specific, transcriptional regulator, Fis family [Bacillota bacterium]